MSSIPLAALHVNPPAPINAGAQLGQLVQMKSALQEQQLRQQQMQMQQQQMKDIQARTKAMIGWDGKDPSDLAKSVLQNGGSADAANAVTQHFLQVKDTASQIALRDAQTGETNLKNIIEKHNQALGAITAAESVSDDQLPQHLTDTINQLIPEGAQNDPQSQQFRQQAMQLINSGLPAAQIRQQLDVMKGGLQGSKEQFVQAQTESETKKNLEQAGEAHAGKLAKEAEEQFYRNNPGAGAPGVPAETAGLASFLQQHPGKTAADYSAWKEGQEAATTQPYKIEAAKVEGQTRQLIEGMEKPVYAYDPKTGQRTLMSATDALQSGLHLMTPVTATEVTNDTMLANRLGDVHQKISRYDQALQTWLTSPGVVNREGEKSSIAGLLSSDKLKAGAFGIELPVDRLNQLANQFGIKTLSPEARDTIISYYNAREAMTGYNRVLSGSGKSNEKNLELQLQTLPDPVSSDSDYARRSIDQFKDNLKVVGQGIPNIPGVKRPEEWEQSVPPATTSTTQKKTTTGWGSQFGGVPHQ